MRLRSAVSRAVVVGLAAAMLAACQPASEAPAAAPAVPPTTAVPPTPDAATNAPRPTHPTLVVETLDHGRFDLAEQRGHWVVVNFWATWCAPCLKEIPDLNALDARRDDLQVIGLAYEEITAEAMRAFYVDKVKPYYPVAILDVYRPPADFETPRGLPFTVLIAPDGAVVHQFLGPVTGIEIEAKISTVSAASTPGPAPPV